MIAQLFGRDLSMYYQISFSPPFRSIVEVNNVLAFLELLARWDNRSYKSNYASIEWNLTLLISKNSLISMNICKYLTIRIFNLVSMMSSVNIFLSKLQIYTTLSNEVCMASSHTLILLTWSPSNLLMSCFLLGTNQLSSKALLYHVL